MKYYDRNGDGLVDFAEFANGLKEPLNEIRLKIVLKAFALLDKDHSGVVTAHDLSKIYDVSKHPDVKSHKKTKEQLLNEFIHGFEKDKDGKLTLKEFISYYEDLGVSIPSD